MHMVIYSLCQGHSSKSNLLQVQTIVKEAVSDIIMIL